MYIWKTVQLIKVTKVYTVCNMCQLWLNSCYVLIQLTFKTPYVRDIVPILKLSKLRQRAKKQLRIISDRVRIWAQVESTLLTNLQFSIAAEQNSMTIVWLLMMARLAGSKLWKALICRKIADFWLQLKAQRFLTWKRCKLSPAYGVFRGTIP